MSFTVAEGVDLARRGEHPAQICRLQSGWVVLANMQYLSGYCILMADPLVGSLNDLAGENRLIFLDDMVRVGDAIQKVTGAYRINYAIMGNTDPTLHAHITPRFLNEPTEILHNHSWAYPPDVMNGRPFDASRDVGLIRKLREVLLEDKQSL